MLVRRQRHVAHPLQELAEGAGTGEPRAQGQTGVEVADQVLDLDLVAIGEQADDDDVVRPRLGMEQRVEGREQRHEQGDAVLRGERLELPLELLRNRERLDAGREGPAAGLRPAAAEVERQGAAEDARARRSPVCARASPATVCRCQRAKSWYWAASGRRGEGRPSRKAL